MPTTTATTTPTKKTTINPSPMRTQWHGSNEEVEGGDGRVEMAGGGRRGSETKEKKKKNTQQSNIK